MKSKADIILQIEKLKSDIDVSNKVQCLVTEALIETLKWVLKDD